MRIKSMHRGVLLIGVVLCITCTRKSPVTPNNPSAHSKITGYAQKGPVLPGSSVYIQALDNHFVPGNQICVLNTRSATGDFEIAQHFESKYLEFRTDAYFFNEVTGIISDGPLTLRTLATPFDSLNVNINVLTTLTFDRIVYLLEKHGNSFVKAKEQANREILSAFQVDIPDALTCDKMLIHREGESHAALLAISAIILGQQKTSDVALFMNRLAEDFKTDGVINEMENLQQLLFNCARLDLPDIRSHLESYWSENDTILPVPQFELFAKKILEFNISGTVPLANATDVLPGTGIAILLNKPVDTAMLSGSAIRLSEAQNEVPGKIVEHSESMQIDFLPDSALAYNTVYTVTVADTLYAPDHSKILPGYFWQFTTTQKPVLEISPDRIDFGAVESQMTLSVNNPSMETVHWHILPALNRLTVEPDSGSLTKAGQNIRFILNREGLAPGEYQETLTIHATCGDDTLPVRFEVPGHSRLTASPPVLTFGGDTIQKILTIQNEGMGTVNWQVASAQSWIKAEPSSGSVTGGTDSVLITVDKSGLSIGQHTGLLTLSSQDTSIHIEVNTVQTHETLTIQADSANWQDTDVWNLDCQSGYAVETGICKTTHFGNNPELRIATGTWQGESATFRTFIRFSPGLPLDAKVDSAILILHADTSFGNNHMEARRVLNYWEEESLDWDSQPEVARGNTDQDVVEVLFEDSRLSKVRIDITGLMCFWQENPLQNFGLRLSHKEEILFKRIVFDSSESPTETLRPSLRIYVNYPNR